MTNQEMSNEFDILYDSIASLGAPDIDLYEKSVFLTQAQLQLIKEYYGPINKYQRSFEGSSKRRTDLRELIRTYEVTPTLESQNSYAMIYTLSMPADLFIQIYEQAKYKNTGCDTIEILEVVPIKHDELHETMRNPFRKPDYKNGFRVDLASTDGVKTVQLYTDRAIDSYQLRYIKYPDPIVLTDLDEISSDLSVDGVTVETPCALDEEIHREILDRAVELAMLAYKPEGLQSKVQLDQRNN